MQLLSQHVLFLFHLIYKYNFFFQKFQLGYSYHSFHSFRRVSFSYSNYCEWTVSVPFLVLEIYRLAAYQHHRHRPRRHLHCVHCCHVLFHRLDHCLNMYYSRFILYISIIFSFKSFNLGIHIILFIHSGVFRFLIETTASGRCPCHSWSWRSTGWKFTNVIDIVHVVIFVVFIVIMFFFIIWIIVLSMVI